jgi:hypothetical protein
LLKHWLLVLTFFKSEHFGRLIVVKHVLVLLDLVRHFSVHFWALVPMVSIRDPMDLAVDQIDMVYLSSNEIGSL